jgi:hypothetical protein
MMRHYGRRRPYTAAGIRRVPCFRCKQPSRHQWQICANGNRYLGVCVKCDVALNRAVLRFFRFPNWKRRVAQYAERIA